MERTNNETVDGSVVSRSVDRGVGLALMKWLWTIIDLELSVRRQVSSLSSMEYKSFQGVTRQAYPNPQFKL